uniref:Uncharacterized protein n=1 Tax=Caenorhabditis japonica TaxID=281687 RepID=A0A8R1ERL9_CAEJA
MSKQGGQMQQQQPQKQNIVMQHTRTTNPDGSQVYLLQPTQGHNQHQQVQFIPVQVQGNTEKKATTMVMNSMMNQPSGSSTSSSTQQQPQQQQQQQPQQQQQQHLMMETIEQVGNGSIGNQTNGVVQRRDPVPIAPAQNMARNNVASSGNNGLAPIVSGGQQRITL